MTKEEKLFHDRLCRVVGCAACRFGHGVFNDYVSIHHCDGRTKDDCECFVLPLCGPHHQTGKGAGDFIAIHPWKARFEDAYGTQEELLGRCIALLEANGHEVPAAARGFAA